MEFAQKLQALRKAHGLTQKELADKLYVSRAAISKWESGRGYPGIDLLRAIASFFSVTVDALLSSDEILDLAKAEGSRQGLRFCTLAVGFLDLLMTMLLFLPCFAQRSSEAVLAASLLSLSTLSPHLKILYFIVIISAAMLGLLTLILQNRIHKDNRKIHLGASFLLSILALLLFTLGLHPYATIFTLSLTGGKFLVWATQI